MGRQNIKNLKTVSPVGRGFWQKILGDSGRNGRAGLFLYLGPEAPGKVYWAEKSPGQRFKAFIGSLDDFGRSVDQAATVFVPGSEVLLAEVTIPHGNRARALKSIPFLIEENLAEDVEFLHFACDRINPAGKTRVAIVSRNRMTAWMTMLSEAGIEAASMVPTSLLLPTVPERWAIVPEGRQWLVGKEGGLPFAVDPENCRLLLSLAEGHGEDDGKCGVTFLTDHGENIDLQALLPGREVEVATASFLEMMTEGYGRGQGIDLLQSEFSRSAQWRGLWRQWQFFVWSALALVLISAVGFSFDYHRLAKAEQRLDAEMKAVFLEVFPNSKRTDNPRVRMESNLKGLQGKQSQGETFFVVYDQVAPVMLQSPGFSLNTLRFKDGRFDFDFELESLQALENLKAVLGKNEMIRAEIRNASASGDKIKAIMQVGIDR
ncbi:MAG: type II secretion system protein GspL [Proteobacteria bacterium]|nr:type II secretion system protein GspL [Pseudomonadota bacterium]MBU1737035.1 type II secretion system protein GspL [Pseudomonadota bacterium]